MNRQQVEAVVRRYYETVDSPTPADVVDLFANDAVYRRPGYEPMVGREALLGFYDRRRVIAEGTHELLGVLVGAPDRAAVEGRFSGRLRDGSSVTLGFADFFTVKEDLIIERSTYFETPTV
ncbi:nuclear transport factor 2 family protein [Nocardioides sp. LHD-245]|uniref:nuclear transport factor 2 family protein n=1 Tax=Nocardioides sp. LHD-245 TaxID=3051387 RepID=UPI0027E00B03|nr:nuclear transport factor 2 family protein [Nocardioides sp. LHD-245]